MFTVAVHTLPGARDLRPGPVGPKNAARLDVTPQGLETADLKGNPRVLIRLNPEKEAEINKTFLVRTHVTAHL